MFRPTPFIAALSLLLSCCGDNALAKDTFPAYEGSASYRGELWHTTGSTSSTLYLEHVLANLAIDGAAAFNWQRWSFLGSVLYTDGHTINESLGTVQGISNIEATEGTRLYELWMQYSFNDRHSLKFGLYDLNSEFDAIDTATLFINPSQGIDPDFSQSGANGPSIFPTTSLALRSISHFGPWAVQLAVLDGVPGNPDHPGETDIHLSKKEGALVVGELNYLSTSSFQAAAGYWLYTAQFADLVATDNRGTPLYRRDNRGYYAFLDFPVFKESDPAQGLDAHLRYGRGNDHINTLKDYFGGSLVYIGAIPGRDTDQLGIAIGSAEAGNPFLTTQQTDGAVMSHRETIIELTYLAQARDWLTLQPDIQYIENPGFNGKLHDVIVYGLRFKLSLRFEQR